MPQTSALSGVELYALEPSSAPCAHLLVHRVQPPPVTLSRFCRKAGGAREPLLFACVGLPHRGDARCRGVSGGPQHAILGDVAVVGWAPALCMGLGRLRGCGPGGMRSMGLARRARQMCGVYGPSAAAHKECRLTQQATGVPHRKDGITVGLATSSA